MSLTSITIPEGVTEIGISAFNCCYSLADITIPNSATHIGRNAFRFCSSLKDIYFSGTEAEWDMINDNYNVSDLKNTTIHFLIKHCFTITQYSDRAEVTNTDSYELSPTVLIAKYEDGILKDLASYNEIFVAGETKNYDFGSSGQYRVFVWDSLHGMQPLNN